MPDEIKIRGGWPEELEDAIRGWQVELKKPDDEGRPAGARGTVLWNGMALRNGEPQAVAVVGWDQQPEGASKSSIVLAPQEKYDLLRPVPGGGFERFRRNLGPTRIAALGLSRVLGQVASQIVLPPIAGKRVRQWERSGPE